MMRWRIDRNADGVPCRMWWMGDVVCPTCNDKPYYVTITGARKPQFRPCPTCSNPREYAGIAPKPLEVL